MEFTIQREDFLITLARIQSVVERRNTMPILGNAYLEVEGDRLTVQGTDLEVSVRTHCPAIVEAPGELTVSARKLFEIVRELPDGSLRLKEGQNDRLAITCGKARFNLLGLPAANFPNIPAAEPDATRFHFDVSTLAEMFDKTHFAMSLDETRYTLNGVLIQFDPGEEEDGELGQIRMVATDTHRLALVENPVVETIETPQDVILPRKAVNEIRKLMMEDEAEAATLVVGEKHFEFILDDVTLVSKLVSGRFPNYRQVVPQGNDLLLELDRRILEGVVKRMAVLSHEKSRGIRLMLEKNLLKINTNNPEQEVADEEMKVSYDGGELCIGFNARYLLEIINAIESDEMHFHIKNDEKPVLVTDPDPQKDHFRFVLMPMRV